MTTLPTFNREPTVNAIRPTPCYDPGRAFEGAGMKAGTFANEGRCVVVGAGPAGLMAAEQIALGGRRVVVYDASASPARKFLLAGRGGLNLTHSEPMQTFLDALRRRRRPTAAIDRGLSPQALRDWAASLGEDTFVGSSGRVFPKSFKATPLLRAWLRRLSELGVEFRSALALRRF